MTVLRTLLVCTVFLGGMFGAVGASQGHALQPGYLELVLNEDERYAVLWKKPANRGQPMAISALLPSNCDPNDAADPVWDGSAYIARWTTRCIGGLEGGVIGIEGLDQTTTDVLVRFDYSDGRSETRRLTPGDSAFTVPAIPGKLEVVRTYTVLGLQHILTGMDHLLFILALLLLVKGVRRLVITVTAFTIAHSITLAGATLGLIHLPGPPVEAGIALSIMFVASEILRSRAGERSLTASYPWVVAFIFGLLHGFGFAGALAQIGLPPASIPEALLFFNVGVELGQLVFIGVVLAVISLTGHAAQYINPPRPAWLTAVPAYFIGSTAAFWMVQRLSDF